MPSPPDAVRSAHRLPGRADRAARPQAEQYRAGVRRQADRAVRGLPEPQHSAVHERSQEWAGVPAEAGRAAEVLPVRQAEQHYPAGSTARAAAAEQAAKHPVRDARQHRSRSPRRHPATGCWECSPTLRSSRMVCGSNTYRLNRHLPAASHCLS